MRPIILTIFIFISTINSVFTQWIQTESFTGAVTCLISVPASDLPGGEVLYLGLEGNEGVWRSTDGGDTWTETAMNDRTVFALAARGSYIFAGTDEDGIYFTSNGGSTWNQTSVANRTVYGFTEAGGYLYAGTKDYGVYCSANNGITWFQTSLNNKTVKSLSSFGSTVFAGTLLNGVYKSPNLGTTWTQTPLNNLHIVCIAVNGTNNEVLAGTDTGLYSSTNLGQSWSNYYHDFEVLSVILSGGTIVTGTDGGVRISYDNGTTWVQRNEGLNGNPLLRTLSVSGNDIIAGVTDHRDAIGNYVYKRPLNEIIGIKVLSSEVPDRFRLLQNYPNPFNPATSIRFSIKSSSEVNLSVFNSSGQQVAELVNKNLSPGEYEYKFDAENLPSGVYFYRLTAEKFSETKKMILVK